MGNMLPRWHRVWGLVCLALCLNVAAEKLAPNRRQDVSSTITSAQRNPEIETTSTPTAPSSGSGSSSVEVTPTTSTETTVAPSAINGNSPSNTTVNNNPVPPGELPLQPRLTPGWGVAGAIMLITGAVYALTGIKNTLLHPFFSAAYLASLSTTVLIVYVMTLPVSDAIQGAYVVAVICTGIILGGAATLLKELTEGLGCLLGGFCLSMWLLTLHDGSLIAALSGKVILIGVLTLATFGLTFSRYTREYALIGSISFSGATVTVLGIDCFSRAGLKEFWAYIWAVNGSLFPLATVTYPLTKGIRVEIAATIILSFVGVISQLKLWRVIQERRAKRAEEEAEAQGQRDAEEANLGQQIEEQTARERRRWEATYGDAPPVSSSSSGDSGSLDEKKHRYSQTVKSTDEKEDVLSDTTAPGSPPMVPPKEPVDGLVVNDGSRVMVRVAGDNSLPPMTEANEKKVLVEGAADGEPKPTSDTSVRNSQRLSHIPQIVPLPFHVSDEAPTDDGDRSSIATFADDDGSIKLSKRGSLNSLGNRLSVGSGNLLRSLSERSQRSAKAKGNSRDVSPISNLGESREQLMEKPKNEDDVKSTAAMADDMSVFDDAERSYKNRKPGRAIEFTAELAGKTSKGNSTAASGVRPRPGFLKGGLVDARPISEAETVATDILTPPGSQQETKDNTAQKEQSGSRTDAESKSSTPKQPRSEASSMASNPGSLTKDRLPSGLSKIALSYRTNEWAKHLSQAETPEPDKFLEDEAVQNNEAAAPVDLESLQQTAQNGAPAPRRMSITPSNAQTFSRTNSQMSMNGTGSTLNRKRASSLSVATAQAPETGLRMSPVTSTFTSTNTNPMGYSFRTKSGNTSRRASRDIIVAPEPIAEEHGDEEQPITSSVRNSSVMQPDDPILPRRISWTSPPPAAGIVSYSAPQTLLGQREMLLRNKSQPALPAPGLTDMTQYPPPTKPPSEAGSAHNYPTQNSYAIQDADDMPLSQRKHILRQNSMMSIASMGGAGPSRSASSLAILHGQRSMTPTADDTHFDSHQPQRHARLPSQAARDAKLANFRQSVAEDLRSSTSPPARNGRETPLMVSASMTSLIQGVNGSPIRPTANDGDTVRQSLEQSRNMMLSQREAEAQRREVERLDKERSERLFVEQMRRGGLMGAHREAMRKMQSAARDH